jgi:hypothetical protein
MAQLGQISAVGLLLIGRINVDIAAELEHGGQHGKVTWPTERVLGDDFKERLAGVRDGPLQGSL